MYREFAKILLWVTNSKDRLLQSERWPFIADYLSRDNANAK